MITASSKTRSPIQSVSDSIPDDENAGDAEASATSPKPDGTTGKKGKKSAFFLQNLEWISNSLLVAIKGKIGGVSAAGKKGTATSKGVEHDAMGLKWNKSMWDNMESTFSNQTL